jgi:hypothetical protein
MPEWSSKRIALSQPRTVSELLRTGLSLYGRYPLLLLALALAVVTPYDLIVLAVTKTAPLQQQKSDIQTTLIELLVSFALVGPLVSALYVQVLTAIGAGERPSLRIVVGRSLAVLPAVVAAQIVAGLAVAAGLFAFVVPGVYLELRFAVVAQAAAAERTDWPGAIKRSMMLTRFNYLRILGVLLIVGLLTVGLASLAVEAAGKGTGAANVVLGIVVGTLTQSFAALIYALLYFDLRARELIRV